MRFCPPLRTLCAVLLVSLVSIPAHAQEQAAGWRGVSRVRGSISISHNSWIQEDYTQSNTLETADLHFVLVLEKEEVPLPAGLPPELVEMMRAAQSQDLPAQLTYRAEEASIVGSLRHSAAIKVGGKTTHDANFAGPPRDLSEFSLVVTPETGEWQLVSPGHLRDDYKIHIVHTGDDPQDYEITSNTVQSVVFDGVTRDPVGALTGTFRREGPLAGRTTRGERKIATLRLWPELKDVALELTIADYAKWRPKGSVSNPTQRGSELVVRATLVSTSGKAEDIPPMKHLTFSLIDTSREPGVCLNWPVGAKDEDYDLRLAPMPIFGGTLDEHGQKNEVTVTSKDAQGRPFAECRVDSFDFGGRASLSVTCKLADGREVVGILKGEGGGQDLVRLPKVKGAGWIAESWLQEKNATGLAEDEDEEKIAGQKDNGDGYTLYEEYRGWRVNGRHLEGDPEAKDFFVLNLVGADAKAGIKLFENVSKLRVHDRLRRDEMSEKTRLMNGNHREAPRRVEQHGVWVKQFLDDPPGGQTGRAKLGLTGAATPLTRSGVAGRPGITLGVGILGRTDPSSDFNKPFNLSAADQSSAYDRAIAHELLHSVGVDHHGTGDSRLSVKWVSPRHPANKVGGPHFRGLMGDKTIYKLLDEKDHDLATQYMQNYAADRKLVETFYGEGMRAEAQAYIKGREGMVGNMFQTAEEYVEYHTEEHVSGGYAFYFAYVGEQHGESSGNQDCLMRYYFAQFYPKNGANDVYYLITPGTERIGRAICKSRDGTGINAPKPPNLPQSRHGAAAEGCGDCFGQICPNDAIPPRAVK